MIYCRWWWWWWWWWYCTNINFWCIWRCLWCGDWYADINYYWSHCSLRWSWLCCLCYCALGVPCDSKEVEVEIWFSQFNMHHCLFFFILNSFEGTYLHCKFVALKNWQCKPSFVIHSILAYSLLFWTHLKTRVGNYPFPLIQLLTNKRIGLVEKHLYLR